MSISAKQRFAILKRDSFTCQYCGRSAPHVELHVDHIHPVSKGGEDVDENLRTACADCNLAKRADVLLSFKTFLAARDYDTQRHELARVVQMRFPGSSLAGTLLAIDNVAAYCDGHGTAGIIQLLAGLEICDTWASWIFRAGWVAGMYSQSLHLTERLKENLGNAQRDWERMFERVHPAKLEPVARKEEPPPSAPENQPKAAADPPGPRPAWLPPKEVN